MQHASFKLVEECAGTGDLLQGGSLVRQVRYRVSRYQGMLEGSGMPVPGLQRIEGTVDLPSGDEEACLVGESLTLRLEDGRSLAVTLAGRDGRILSEGHGPRGGCGCC